MYARGGGALGRGAMGQRGGNNPAGGRGSGRYLKGRLPEGVGFQAYPGRSSTPMPTAESKSAERMNQLKIWNEAAAGKEGVPNRLSAGTGRRGSAGSGSGSIGLSSSGVVGGRSASRGERRTDSFKEAKERHSSSFVDENEEGGQVRENHIAAADVMGEHDRAADEARFDDRSASGSSSDGDGGGSSSSSSEASSESGEYEDERMQDADEHPKEYAQRSSDTDNKESRGAHYNTNGIAGVKHAENASAPTADSPPGAPPRSDILSNNNADPRARQKETSFNRKQDAAATPAAGTNAERKQSKGICCCVVQ